MIHPKELHYHRKFTKMNQTFQCFLRERERSRRVFMIKLLGYIENRVTVTLLKNVDKLIVSLLLICEQSYKIR